MSAQPNILIDYWNEYPAETVDLSLFINSGF